MNNLAAPSLVLIGTGTLPGLMRSSLLAMAGLPSARLDVLKGHGHSAIGEGPAMHSEVVIRFLEDHVPAQVQSESFHCGAP